MVIFVDTEWSIYKGSYQQATECRHQHVSIFTYLDNTDTNITGYFWINKQLQQWQFILRGKLLMVKNDNPFVDIFFVLVCIEINVLKIVVSLFKFT